MPLATPSVIIVSPLGCVHHIRNALLRSGATTHVFNTYGAALTLLRRKKIDTVVLEFSQDQATADFCEAVRSLNIPLVYASPSVKILGTFILLELDSHARLTRAALLTSIPST